MSPRLRGRRRWCGALVASAIAVLATPGTALADAAGPTDFRTEIVSISPATEAVDLTVEGGDAFLRLAVAPGHEAMVLGYDDEPYLRFLADGTVERNARSYATYYNEERYGGTDIPDIVDHEAEPRWERVGGGGAWAWHDHRAHWMSEEPPLGLGPGDSLPAQVVPIVVDGQPIDVEVVTTLQADASWWPAVFGALIGLQLVLLGALAGPATTVLGGLVLAVGALVTGSVQYGSLPAETGPLLTWWLLPALAVVCLVATIAIYGRSVLVQHALVALAGLQLALWGFRRRDGLTAAVLPTDLPFWFDRVATAAALAGGIALTLVALKPMLWPDHREPGTS